MCCKSNETQGTDTFSIVYTTTLYTSIRVLVLVLSSLDEELITGIPVLGRRIILDARKVALESPLDSALI